MAVPGTTRFPGNLALGATRSAELSQRAGFALGRMRLGKGGVISTTALLFYTVPAYFLVIPFYRLMHEYGLMDSLWAVIAALPRGVEAAILSSREFWSFSVKGTVTCP